MLRGVAIVTADLGPDRSVSAMRITDVSSISFNYDKGILVVEHGILRSEFAYTGITSVVFAISGGVTTVTIS